jgi:hypothetical protein
MSSRPGRSDKLKTEQVRITAHIMLSSGLPVSAIPMVLLELSGPLLLRHFQLG